MLASLCQHDCAIAILIETFFINSAAKIICFSLQYGVDGLALLVIFYRVGLRFSVKPPGFEDSHQVDIL